LFVSEFVDSKFKTKTEVLIFFFINKTQFDTSELIAPKRAGEIGSGENSSG
jgi:hypothetical protein